MSEPLSLQFAFESRQLLKYECGVDDDDDDQ